MSKIIAAILTPVIALSAMTAEASDLCDRLQARLNQMPEIVGTGMAAQLKGESLYRLNLLERAVRNDLRRMQCPTDSVVYWDADQAEACSRLGQELAGVMERKQSMQDLQPVLSQHVDDGSGMLPSILAEMRKARCQTDEPGAQVQAINNAPGSLNADKAVYSSEPVYSSDDAIYPEEQAVYPGEQGDTDDMAGVVTQGDGTDGGEPQSYGMIEVRPGEMKRGNSVTSVELPKLEGSSAMDVPGVSRTAPVTQEAAAPSLPLRDYNPNDQRVRKVGPTFLADDGSIDLRHPAN